MNILHIMPASGWRAMGCYGDKGVISQSSSEFRFQEALEEFNRFKDDARMKSERLGYVHEASRLPILDAYLRGELALLLHVYPFFKVDAIGRPLELAHPETGEGLPFFILHLNSVNMAFSQNGDKQPMFVSVVEIVNGPDGIIPSFARLYCVEHEPEEFRGGSVYFNMSQKTFQFFHAFADGEFRPVILKGRNDSLDGLQPRIVEGGFKVMNSIPNHECEIVEGFRIAKSVGESLSSVLWVNLNNSGVSFIKRSDAPFDIADMFIGPLNFEASVMKQHC